MTPKVEQPVILDAAECRKLPAVEHAIHYLRHLIEHGYLPQMSRDEAGFLVERLRTELPTPAQPATEPLKQTYDKLLDCARRDGEGNLVVYLYEAQEAAQAVERKLLLAHAALNDSVTATQARPEGAEWKPDSMQANTAPFLGTCETPHFLGEPTPDRKALTQIPHYSLPQDRCKNWQALRVTAPGSADGWVSVKTEPPHGDVLLVVINKTVQHMPAIWDGAEWTWLDSRDEDDPIPPNKITHWRPLPSSPGASEATEEK